MIIEKRLNPNNGNEYLIRNVRLFNKMIKCGDYAVGELNFDASLASFTNRITEETYNFPLYNSVDDIELINTTRAQRRANAYFNNTLKKNCFPNTDIPKKQYTCLGGHIYYNPQTAGKVLRNVYAYDINSAYLSVLATGYYPDVDAGDCGYGIANEDYIGFNIMGDTVLLAREGELADMRFMKRRSKKVAKFAKEMFEEIVMFKSAGEKVKAKETKLMVNSLIGVLRNHNVFYYTYIVSTCRYYMESLKDERTILCNTDGIITIGERDDLPISAELGEFKIEAENVSCFHRGTNYALFREDEDGLETLALKERGVVKAKQNIQDFINGGRSAEKPDYKVVKNTVVPNYDF